MTDREKIIEEMAGCENCYAKSYDIITDILCCHYDCEKYQVCEKLKKQGYRKVPEGAVVLTKEEYERLASYISEERAREIFHEETEKLKEKISKETAMKFAQELIKHFEEQKKRYDMCIDQRRKDLLKLSENEQELREYTIRCEGKENGQWVAADKSVEYINKLLKEKYGVEVEE